MHRRYDDGEPEADAGDEPQSHERRVAAAERHGERAGHEEEVGEYQRGAAERMDTSMYTFMEPAAVLLRQLVEKTQERRKEAPSPTSTTPPPFVSSKMITFDQQKLPGTVYNTPN